MTSDEARLLRETVERFVRETYPFESRQSRRTQPPHLGWSRLAELGLLALPLRSDVGGTDAELSDMLEVFAAFGGALVEEPYLEGVLLAAKLVDEIAAPTQRESLLPPLISGARRFCLAHREYGNEFLPDSVRCVVRRSGSTLLLSGHKRAISAAEWVDTLLVSARIETGIGVFMLAPDTPGVTSLSYARTDGARAVDIRFDEVQLTADAQLGGDVTCVWSAVHRVLLRGAAGLCAEAVGIGRALRDATRSYLMTRKQFGQTLASFQALQHRFADLAIHVMELEAAAALAADAATDLDDAESEGRIRAAKARVGVLGRRIAEESIQLHGGVGFTEELVVGHYLRRMLVIDDMLGSSDEHLAWLAVER